MLRFKSLLLFFFFAIYISSFVPKILISPGAVPSGILENQDQKEKEPKKVKNELKHPCEPVYNESKEVAYFICQTGLGIEITTNAEGFIRGIFQIILGISGGIALVLIIISGYRIMTSRANPEKIQQGKEQLTSAIIGLLFIIFSIVILQVIGVDILRIRGFEP